MEFIAWQLWLLECMFFKKSECTFFFPWPTWNQLRVVVYGFRGLSIPLPWLPHQHQTCEWERSWDTQLKHSTGGNLTGYSYETAKATLLMKQSVQESQKTTTVIPPSTLGRQNYNKNQKFICKWYMLYRWKGYNMHSYFTIDCFSAA